MFATAGARLYLGDVMDGGGDVSASSFAHITTWVELGGITNLGRSGLRAEVERVVVPNCDAPDDPDLVRKDVVSLDGGSMTILADLQYDDEGQQLVWASVGGPSRAVRLVLPSLSGPAPVRLFVAIVTAADEQWNEANNVMQFMTELELDSRVVRSTL